LLEGLRGFEDQEATPRFIMSQQSLIDGDPSSAPLAEAGGPELKIVRSWKSFESFFEEAKRLWAVTYCETPQVLLKLFNEHGLEKLEVVVGDAADYRERLTDEEIHRIARLERLKRKGRLRIYTCPRKTVHSKFYLLDLGDGDHRVLHGSANLTKNSWANHTNSLTVWEASEPSSVLDMFWEHYRTHREDYGELFHGRPHRPPH
jgi:phosphatidylserine/phosphatidylglycerophosphate/cardiolipin synthase-like enzyme